MKIHFAILAALTAACHAQTAVNHPVTARDLTARQQNASLAVLDQTPPTSGETVAIRRSAGQSLISQSEILHDGQNWTLVPRGAVLYVPKTRMANVGVRPVGTLLPWIEFLTKNPGWLSTHETSFDQASGDKPLPPEKTEFWKKQDRVIIAVHQGGPISVAR